MNALIMCTAAVLNIFSLPAGNVAVGQAPYGVPVQIMDRSMLGDWVFVGKPTPGGALPSPRGWVLYSALGYCPANTGQQQQAPQEGDGS